MKSTQRRRPPKRKKVSIRAALSQGLRHLLTARVGWYAPAVVPVLLSILAHLLTLVAFLLIRCGLVSQNPMLYTNMITWGVYGFIPLLLCSYAVFFVLTRVGIQALVQKLPHWSTVSLHLAIGGGYGIATGLALLLLLQPGVGPKSLLLFLVGLISGLGNWYFYRKLLPEDPLADLQMTKPGGDESVQE